MSSDIAWSGPVLIGLVLSLAAIYFRRIEKKKEQIQAAKRVADGRVGGN